MKRSCKICFCACGHFFLILVCILLSGQGLAGGFLAASAEASEGLPSKVLPSKDTLAGSLQPDRRASSSLLSSGDRTPAPPKLILAQKAEKSESKARDAETGKVWKSHELELLAVGLGVGDVDGDGRNEIVVADPSTVYLYRLEDNKLRLVTKYSVGSLEVKTVDVANIRKQGPAKIYVSAQNRGAVASFVLEYRNGALVPVIQDFGYFLRVIDYPTRGPILLGQQKGSTRMYDGPIYQLMDKGDDLEVQGRFGVPLKIPIFGFAIGDLEGKRKPLVAVYDKSDHLRIYEPTGKRLYVSREYYGGTDVLLRWGGPESKRELDLSLMEEDLVFLRPRIMALDVARSKVYQVLVTKHHSKTMRLLGRTKMLEEGQVMGLAWNGDAMEERWGTPKIQGMVMDFTVETLPGLQGEKLITLERKRTDWLAFLRSRSQIRAYDLQSLVREGNRHTSSEAD